MTRTFALVACALVYIGVHQASAADLPSPDITPGVVREGMTTEQVCGTKWGQDARAVTLTMKRHVATAYGFTPDQCPSGRVEYDHLISRELAGADDERNLWPECYEIDAHNAEWGAHKKDRLENRLHREVCAGRLDLGEAQRSIARDWIALYRQYFGTP